MIVDDWLPKSVDKVEDVTHVLLRPLSSLPAPVNLAATIVVSVAVIMLSVAAVGLLVAAVRGACNCDDKGAGDVPFY